MLRLKSRKNSWEVSFMGVGMIIFLIVFAIVMLYILVTYNSLIKYRNLVKEAFSTMDIYLKKRWDLIPNLVETIKGYANHEKETLEKVVALRNSSYENIPENKKININEQLTRGISKIMAIAESYPELKANENFMELSKDLTKIEDEIAHSRRYYNGTVRNLNNKIQMFPSNIVAKIFGFKSANMFEAGDEEKNNVKVNLQNETKNFFRDIFNFMPYGIITK